MKKVLLSLFMLFASLPILAQDATVIGDLYNTTNDTEVTVEGTVTTPVGALGSGNFYIQDETGGIAVYISGDTMPELMVGSITQVKGILTIANNGEYSITVADAADVTPMDGENAELVPASILTDDAPRHLAELVRAEGIIIGTTWYWGDDYLIMTSNEDPSNGNLIIYLPGSLATDFGTSEPINGETVCITGIVKTFNLAGDYYFYGVIPRSGDDLMMGACEA